MRYPTIDTPYAFPVAPPPQEESSLGKTALVIGGVGVAAALGVAVYLREKSTSDPGYGAPKTAGGLTPHVHGIHPGVDYTVGDRKIRFHPMGDGPRRYGQPPGGTYDDLGPTTLGPHVTISAADYAG